MLLVAGRRPDEIDPTDADMDLVTSQIEQSASIVVRRCDDPLDLPYIVEAVARQSGPIDVLDIYDHGGAGLQRLGRDIWVESDGDRNKELFGADTVVGLRDYLADTAQVRLLGCGTAGAISVPGRLLLIKMARLLGGRRVVLGTIKPLRAIDFCVAGLRRGVETDMLFSSLAAIDMAPPTDKDRQTHILDVRQDP